MHPQSVRTVLLGEDEIWQFQLAQLSASHLRVSIVTSPSADHRRIAGGLPRDLPRHFGHGIMIEIRFVDAIDRTWKGKFRAVADSPFTTTSSVSLGLSFN